MNVFLFAINMLIFSINFPTFALEQNIEIEEEATFFAMSSSEESVDTRYELGNNKENRNSKSAKKKISSIDKKGKKKRKRSESSSSEGQEETTPKKKKRANNKKKKFECTHEGCDKKYARKDSLRLHLKLHTGERPYACTFKGCNETFTRKDILACHLRIHTGERPFACSYEGCNKAFTQKATLLSHLTTHTGERPFACSYEGCNKAFAQETTLLSHLATHTGERPFACSYEGCNKAFTQKATLLSHLTTHKERIYGCTYEGCEKAYADEKQLAKHLKVHSGEKNHVCSHAGCTSAFMRKWDLKRHLKTHSGERPYICEYCQVGFTSKQCLKNHLKIHQNRNMSEALGNHTGKPRFICVYCKESFAPQGFGRHLKKHEKIKCEAILASQSSSLIMAADVEKKIPNINPERGIKNCREAADKVHKWLKWQTQMPEAVDPELTEEGNITFITTRDGSEEYATLTNHLVAREMARPQSSEHVIDDEQSSCHIHKPKFIKKNSSELESYIESLPRIKFKDGNYYVTGILYLESKTEEGKGHFLNFYTYFLGDEKHSYIIDGQTAVIESVENFIPMSAYFYKDDFFVWHDNEHSSLVAVTAHWEDQISEELVTVKKEPNSDEEEQIQPLKKNAKRKNSGSDLNQEAPKRARLNEANGESGRATKRKTRKSKDSDDEDFEPGKEKSKRKKRQNLIL